MLTARLGIFDLEEENQSKSLDNRLKRAWSHFTLWLLGAGLTVAGLRSFSTAKMHYARAGNYPWLGCKASDTPTLLKWMVFLTTLHLSKGALSADTQRVLSWIQLAAQGGLRFTQGLHGHGLFFRASCAAHLRSSLHDFQQGYLRLAQHCLTKRLALFGMTPKMHSLSHFRYDLDKAIRSGRRMILNPACWDCSMSEDFIGRVARQSRRIAFKRNTFERQLLRMYLLKVKFVLARHVKKDPSDPSSAEGREGGFLLGPGWAHRACSGFKPQTRSGLQGFRVWGGP